MHLNVTFDTVKIIPLSFDPSRTKFYESFLRVVSVTARRA